MDFSCHEEFEKKYRGAVFAEIKAVEKNCSILFVYNKVSFRIFQGVLPNVCHDIWTPTTPLIFAQF